MLDSGTASLPYIRIEDSLITPKTHTPYTPTTHTNYYDKKTPAKHPQKLVFWISYQPTFATKDSKSHGCNKQPSHRSINENYDKHLSSLRYIVKAEFMN